MYALKETLISCSCGLGLLLIHKPGILSCNGQNYTKSCILIFIIVSTVKERTSLGKECNPES
jgi:hypothetical protein